MDIHSPLCSPTQLHSPKEVTREEMRQQVGIFGKCGGTRCHHVAICPGPRALDVFEDLPKGQALFLSRDNMYLQDSSQKTAVPTCFNSSMGLAVYIQPKPMSAWHPNSSQEHYCTQLLSLRLEEASLFSKTIRRVSASISLVK